MKFYKINADLITIVLKLPDNAFTVKSRRRIRIWYAVLIFTEAWHILTE
jgi:hypothetical protein